MIYTRLHPSFILLNWGVQGYTYFFLIFAQTSTDAKCVDTFKQTGVSKESCSGSCAKCKGEKGGLQSEFRNKDV